MQGQARVMTCLEAFQKAVKGRAFLSINDQQDRDNVKNTIVDHMLYSRLNGVDMRAFVMSLFQNNGGKFDELLTDIT
jgi:hypothetical protein